MPAPDPQPPKPRAVSPARWLLMLLPSVPMMLAPLVANARQRLPYSIASDENIGIAIGTFLWSCSVSALLCFYFGFRLEKWRWGVVKEWERPLGYGLLILTVNSFIAFAGCTLPGIIF